MHFSLSLIIVVAFRAADGLSTPGFYRNLARRPSNVARCAAKANLAFCLLVFEQFKARYRIRKALRLTLTCPDASNKLYFLFVRFAYIDLVVLYQPIKRGKVLSLC